MVITDHNDEAVQDHASYPLFDGKGAPPAEHYYLFILSQQGGL